jgi:excisionase family DNA binding protein
MPRRMSDRLLTARELADYLGLSSATVLDWFEAGRLPGFRLGGRKGGPVRFRVSEVEAVLEEWRVAPDPAIASVRAVDTPVAEW